MSRLFFTSDLHFGHKNIIKFCPRSRGKYQNVDEMNEDMIRIWNKTVGEDDDVYHLGDMTFYHRYNDLANILRRLNGRIHHIMGNHDQLIIDNRDRFISDGLIYSIQDYKELKLDGQKVVLCHFPFAVWNKNHHGSINLYGHCHGSFKAVGKQCDVGWDTNDFPGRSPAPISWEEIRVLMETRSIVAQDHHDADNIR